MLESEQDRDKKVKPMRESEEARGEAGDVETAGETTAADATGSDTSDPRPVGADTLARVDEQTKREDGADAS